MMRFVEQDGGPLGGVYGNSEETGVKRDDREGKVGGRVGVLMAYVLVPPVVAAAIEDDVSKHPGFALETAPLDDSDGLGHHPFLLISEAVRSYEQ